MSRWLIVAGLALLALGLVWPWLVKLGLGHLPGDIHVEREGFHFYFPLATGIVISLLVSLIVWLLRR